MTPRYREFLDPTIFFVVLALAWEYGVGLFGVKAYLLPPLSDIVVAGWENRAHLLKHSWVTAEEVIYGFISAVAGGLLLAIGIFFVPVLRRVLYPFIAALQGVPKVALAPLMVVWFGYGITSKVMMSFLFAFFPIVISTLGGFYSTPANLEEHFRALRASPWRTFWRLRMPAALPNFIDGCKVAMPLAVIGAIVGEFVGASEGLGQLLTFATSGGRTDLVFATLIVITVLAMLLFWVIQFAGRWVWWRAM